MSKPIKFFLVLFALLSFNFSATAYKLQFADASKTVRLHWKKNKIQIALSTSLSLQSDAENAVRRSLETWEQIADIKFEITWTDKQSVSPSGNFGDGVSLITIAQTPENLLLFGNETDEISAQTRTFYNRQGFINEADIILNPYQQFSSDGTIGTYDLEATLTHEIGHLLGLEHSSVMGATMQARQGKNGIYNLSAFASRTLAEDDLTGFRALYGTKNSEESCCGIVVGKIVQTKGKTIRKLQVWAEDANSGRVIGSVSTNSDGSFRFEGLKAGSYRFYTQDEGQDDTATAEELGIFEIIKAKTLTITKKLKTPEKNFSVQYTGFNGQISDLAVPLNGGKSYLIYIGGKNLDAENLIIGFNSPYLSITPNSIVKHDYGSEVSVVSFEIKIDTETPAGEYSLFVKSQSGARQFLVGGLTVENFLNPWNSYVLPVNNKE
ncbi:MAG TPA: matrixin family metalloprotease [Pyrinomonadaceae bacterium]|nr:matrixin family metalloprotease [Pyrinomonadaceae bacterium]